LAIPIKKKQFDQVYLPCHTEGGEIRLRADDDESRLSIARKTDSGSRVRLETELEKHIYQVLRCQAAGHPITKTRYTFFYEGLEWRFDVFAEESHLAGLHLLEVTLPVKDARFTLPPPFKGSEDVTGNPEYDNKSLALSKGE
jgi:CYTH domain-containing protein